MNVNMLPILKRYFLAFHNLLLKKKYLDIQNILKNDYNLIEYDIEVEKAYFEVFLGRILYHKL